MEPPETQAKPVEKARKAAPAVSLYVMKKRADFLKAARGQRVAMPGFVLQARARRGDGVRVGYTCTKKLGNAVARNRAKRRLREIARAVFPTQAKAGHDYVLIGRRLETAARPYHIMLAELENALKKIHTPRPRK